MATRRGAGVSASLVTGMGNVWGRIAQIAAPEVAFQIGEPTENHMKRSEVTDRCASSWRRRFLQGLGAAIGLAGFSPGPLFAAQDRRKLRGTSFDLEIGPMPVNFTGADRIATAVNGQVPAPTLYWNCLLYTSPSPRDRQKSRMPSSA